MLASNALSILLRWLRGRGIFSLPFGIAYFFLVVSYIGEVLVYYILSSAGTPTRDASGNVVRPPSVDLASPGYFYEWMFDVLYVTCELHLLSCMC